MRDERQTEYERTNSRRSYGNWSSSGDADYAYNAQSGASVGFVPHRERYTSNPEPAVSPVSAYEPEQAAPARSGGIASAIGGVRDRIFTGSAQTPRYEPNDYLGVGVPCRLCGNPVDRMQSRCPHCGALVKPFYTRIFFWIPVVLLIACLVLLTWGLTTCKVQQEEAAQHVMQTYTVEELQELVDKADYALVIQSESHIYTRYTAYMLRQDINNSKSVIENTASTTAEISEAYASLNAAYNGLSALLSEFQWPSWDDVSANPEAYNGVQVAFSGTVNSVNWDENWGVSSATLQPQENSTLLNVKIAQYDLDDPDNPFWAGSEVILYGQLVYDGTSITLWADRGETVVS